MHPYQSFHERQTNAKSSLRPLRRPIGVDCARRSVIDWLTACGAAAANMTTARTNMTPGRSRFFIVDPRMSAAENGRATLAQRDRGVKVAGYRSHHPRNDGLAGRLEFPPVRAVVRIFPKVANCLRLIPQH
jgi:hypothetical protein